MPRNLLLFSLSLCCLFSFQTSAEELTLEPRGGVLLLKNQQVFEGKITKLGDYYHLALGETGEIRISKDDVQWHCANLQEVYDRKVEKLPSRSLEAHLALGEWCLRQKMYGQTAEQLVKAMAIQPKDVRLARLEQRLTLATQPPAEVKVGRETSPATVGKEQLERTANELPTGALERFTVVVQPLVMDHCGAVSCHGGSADTRFQIVQPTASRTPSRRFTQRNLFSVLELVDREQPNDSQLLKLAREPHGGAKQPPLGKDDERAFRQLSDWVNALSSPHLAHNHRPPTVNVRQLAGPQQQVGAAASSASEPGAASLKRSPESPVANRADPFDPAPFNHRFFETEKP